MGGVRGGCRKWVPFFRFITGVNMCQRIVVTVYMIRIISDYANTHGCTI